MDFGLNAYIVAADGSVTDINGKTILFSFERFRSEICKRGHCFVCGAPKSRAFNDEHIVPNWLLKYCRMHNETLTLPNGNRVRYGTYKIPCCEHATACLPTFTKSPSVKPCAGYDGVMGFVTNGGLDKLCAWLSLIFTKVHLRDFRNGTSLDARENDGVKGDHCDLSELHHARAVTAGVQVDKAVFGTLVILRLDPSENDVAFDYCDNRSALVAR